MRKFKKIISIVLILALSLSVFSGCGKDEKDEVITIAVAVGTYNGQNLAAKDYFENYLAKELNIKFIFSEEGSTVEQILNFVENAYSSGAQAVIDLATSSVSDVEPIAAKCNELGMYFATYYGGTETILEKFDTAIGGVDNDNELLKVQFYNLTKNLINDGKSHNMVLCPVAARYNNVQQMSSAMGSLSAFNDVYSLGLTEEQMLTYVKKDAVTDINTGRTDVKIAINPMFVGDALTELLKKGEYDVVTICGDIYLRLEAAIADAEKTTKKNINVISVTAVADETYNSFNTKDNFGNSSLNAAALTSSARAGIMVSMVLNGVYGDIDAVRKDGKVKCYALPLWECDSAEKYIALNKLDRDESTYVFTADEIKQMVKKFNPEMNSDYLAKHIKENVAVDAVLARRGLK